MELATEDFFVKAKSLGVCMQDTWQNVLNSDDELCHNYFVDFENNFPKDEKTSLAVSQYGVMTNRVFFTNKDIWQKVSGKFDVVNRENVELVRHNCISEMAYRFWELEGYPDNRNEQNWAEAERQFDNAISNWTALNLV